MDGVYLIFVPVTMTRIFGTGFLLIVWVNVTIPRMQR